MTEKEAIMVLQMVEAHGSLPIKAKAMAIEALRLAERCGQVWEVEISDRERCYQYSDAVANYYDCIDIINNQLEDNCDIFDIPTLKKIHDKLRGYTEAEDET